MYAELGEDRIVLQSAWSDKESIKLIPGASWDKDDRVWTLPLSWSSCVMLRGVFKERLVLGPQLKLWGMKERVDRVDTVMAIREKTDVPASLSWTDSLYGFQRAGVAFLLASGSALLGDEMGTGKTIQTLSTLRALHLENEALPALVVCPNSMKAVWAREAKKWLPGAVPYVVQGTAAKRRKILTAAGEDPHALVIINFESVRAHSRTAGFGSIRLARCADCGGTGEVKEANCEVHVRELNAIGFQVVVVDEAHRIKDAQAKQTRAIWAASQGKTVTRRYALTGTPVANSPVDLWSIMHFVDPVDFPRKSAFVNRFCEVSFNAQGGMETAGLRNDTKDEFFKIFHPRFRRMPKKLVLPQLPEKVRSTVFVQMTDKQRKAYEQMAEGLVTRLDDGTLMVAKENIVANTRLLQFSSAYMEKTGTKIVKKIDAWSGEEVEEEVDVFAMREPSPKLDAMEEILDSMNGKPVVIAAESRQLIKLAETRLAKAGVEFGLIVGDTPQWQRDLYVQQFQKGELKVILLTMQAGGVGITLTAADTMICLQRSWSEIINKQTEDRIHRIGSEVHESIHIIDIVTEDTVEVDQVAKLVIKAEIAQEVVQDAKTLQNAAL